MSLPEPGQEVVKKEEATLVSSQSGPPARPVAVVEDAGQFITPTVPVEISHVVTSTPLTPPVTATEVSHVGVGTPVVTGQETATVPSAKNIIQFKRPNLGILGLRAAGNVSKWREVQAEYNRKRRKLKTAA
ncbi:hypothetical protein HYT17_00820 [Candidatus Microgenomates bacterium]|nr:hypothetical protein [Candidatus Microgenomates bacterium]